MISSRNGKISHFVLTKILIKYSWLNDVLVSADFDIFRRLYVHFYEQILQFRQLVR